MTLASKVQLGLLVGGALLAGWGWRHHHQQARALAALRMQLEAQQQEQASREQALEAAAQRNAELVEAERRVGNGTLLALLRERNTAHLAASEAAGSAATAPGLGGALARALQSRQDQQAHDDARRAQLRSGLYQFFKLLNLSPEKQEQYIDLNLEKERRMADRLAALLQGKLSVEAAAQQRDQDEAANDQRAGEVLGEEGKAFLDGIADGMRNDTAKLMLGLIQQNLGENRLSPEQGAQLQALLKAEIVPLKMDDVELFRPPEAWAQYYVGVQQKISAAAAGFLSPAQLEALKTIGAYDLAQRQKQMAARRAALGIQ